MKNTFQSGFTLIELLVVIAIIGILAGLLTANFIGVRMRSRDATRKSDLRQIQAALELYRADNGMYSTWSLASGWACAGLSEIPGIEPDYMGDIPEDVQFDSSLFCTNTNHCYLYAVVGDGSLYTLYAHLENAEDADARRAKTDPSYLPETSTISPDNTQVTIASGVCGGVTFNYWLNNP